MENSAESMYQRTSREKRNVQKFTLGEKYQGLNRSVSYDISLFNTNIVQPNYVEVKQIEALF